MRASERHNDAVVARRRAAVRGFAFRFLLMAQVSSYGDKAGWSGERQAAGDSDKVGIAQNLNAQLPLG
jgi:hypothetical protein